MLLSGHRRNRSGKLMRACYRPSGRKWTRTRYPPRASPLWYGIPTLRKISDAVKRYSYLLGQTELFKHFVDIKVRPVIKTPSAVTFLIGYLESP